MLDFPMWRALMTSLAGDWFLERLFFSCIELAVLTLVVAVALRVIKSRAPRFVTLLWVIVLANSIVSLVVGTPYHLFELQVPTDQQTVNSAPFKQIEPTRDTL